MNYRKRVVIRCIFQIHQKPKKMRIFTSPLLEFAVTEISRFFKSDETILAQKIDTLLEIYHCNAILEESISINESHQMRAEELGDRYGGKLGIKLANPWNFIDISLLTDREDIVEIIDNSKEVRKILFSVLKQWDALISKIMQLSFEKVVLDIASAKTKKKGIDLDTAIKESLMPAAKHPKSHKCRLVLNFTYDASEFKEEENGFAAMLKSARDMIGQENKTIPTRWEIYKKYMVKKNPK